MGLSVHIMLWVAHEFVLDFLFGGLIFLIRQCVRHFVTQSNLIPIIEFSVFKSDLHSFSNFSFNAFSMQEKHIFTHLCLNLEHNVLLILVCSFSWLKKWACCSLFFLYTSYCDTVCFLSSSLYAFRACEKWQLDQAVKVKVSDNP